MGATGVSKAAAAGGRQAVGYASRAAANEEGILRLVGRFGAMRPDQIARWLDRDPAAVRREIRGLGARGLLRPVPLEEDGAAVALSAGGLRRLPALLPKQRVHARAAGVLVATADVAADLLLREGGDWYTWPEAVRDGLVMTPPPGPAPAEGLVVPDRRGAGPEPVCVIPRRQNRRALRERVAAAARCGGGARVRIFAPERLCAEITRQTEGLGAVITAFEPAGPEPRAAGAPSRGGGRGVLTAKRTRALRLLALFGYATVDQMAREQGSHSTAASIMLAALEKAGMVQRHRAHHLHKDVYSATEAGLAALGLGLPPVPRVPAQRRHALALVDLAHTLTVECGAGWQTQRELAAEWARRPDWAGLDVPDGLLVFPDGRRVAVELELSSQPRHAVLQFVAAHAAARSCQEIWYVVSPEWERRYLARLADAPGVRVRGWEPPDRMGGPRGFRADRVTREPSVPRILGRGRRRG